MKFQKESSAFDSGMRGSTKAPVKGRDKATEAPVPKVFASGMRGSEQFLDSEPAEAPASTTEGEVQQAESDAGVPAEKGPSVHNSASLVSQDDTHYTLRLPKKLFAKVSGNGKA